MSSYPLENFAIRLNEAALGKKELARLTLEHPSLSIPEAYQVQDALISRHQARGEKVIGWKMGLTSKPKMKQMGVEAPIYGVLTDRMQIEDGSRLDPGSLIHPKIEPEVAFILKHELKGAPSLDQAWASVGEVCAAMEIIDSRYRNFEFQLPDVIADNCSSSRFVLARKRLRADELRPEFGLSPLQNLGNFGILLEKGGTPVQFGSSAALLGHPVASLAELARMMSARGRSLPAGAIVLAGAATQAIALEPGQEYRTMIETLGEVTLHT